MEDSRRSLDKLTFSDNFSINNISKGIKYYHFNKAKNFFLSEIVYTERKKVKKI
jgi:hypothetical protein